MVASVRTSTKTSMTEDGRLGRRLDAIIEQATGTGGIVGTVVAVARDGRVAYQRAAGFRDREAATAMTADAIFRLASLTKPIVSVAALAMVQEGKIRLGDAVSSWIPEFRPKLADGREPAITVHQLLTHTAGLTYGFFEPADGPYHAAGVSDGMDQPGLSMAENLRRIASVPLSYEPGTSWGYSVATDVLGEILARADGRSLPDVVRARVTGPLGMPDTDFTVRDRSRLATAYADGDPQPVRMAEHQLVPFFGNALSFAPDRILDPGSYPSAGTGMAGTAGDFLKLLEVLRTGGSLLSADTVAELSRNQIGDFFVPAAGPGWGYGLLSVVLKDAAEAGTPQSAGTLRWGGVYGNNWFVDPERGLAVVVLTNTAVAGMVGQYPDAIRDALYGEG